MMVTWTVENPVMLRNNILYRNGDQPDGVKFTPTHIETGVYTWPDGMTLDEAAHQRRLHYDASLRKR